MDYEKKYQDLRAEFEHFVYIVSHDLKAPVRGISNLTDWIVEDLGSDLDEDVAYNIHLLKNRTAKLEAMVDALASLSRVDRYDMDLAAINLKVVLENELGLIEKPSNLNISFDVDVPEFKSLGRKLSATCAALLKNAIEFADPDNPIVSIAASCESGWLRVTFSNNGQGVAEHVKERMYRIFTTTKTSDSPVAQGVGLTLAKKIVDYVGGTLSYEQSEDTTTFQFTWPLELKAVSFS